jgi:hypothetical protein
MIKPDELSGDARRFYDTWRRIGLSESQALETLRRDGLVETRDYDRTVNMFRNVFGLSEATATRAAEGRDGLSRRPASGPRSEPGRSSSRPEAGDAFRVVRKIEELAAGMCSGVSEEKALREAAFAVIRAAPDDWTQEWAAKVIEHRWPALWTGSGSSGSGRATGTVHG